MSTFLSLKQKTSLQNVSCEQRSQTTVLFSTHKTISAYSLILEQSNEVSNAWNWVAFACCILQILMWFCKIKCFNIPTAFQNRQQGWCGWTKVCVKQAMMENTFTQTALHISLYTKCGMCKKTVFLHTVTLTTNNNSNKDECLST
jgi:hypothetical protein